MLMVSCLKLQNVVILSLKKNKQGDHIKCYFLRKVRTCSAVTVCNSHPHIIVVSKKLQASLLITIKSSKYDSLMIYYIFSSFLLFRRRILSRIWKYVKLFFCHNSTWIICCSYSICLFFVYALCLLLFTLQNFRLYYKCLW